MAKNRHRFPQPSYLCKRKHPLSLISHKTSWGKTTRGTVWPFLCQLLVHKPPRLKIAPASLNAADAEKNNEILHISQPRVNNQKEVIQPWSERNESSYDEALTIHIESGERNWSFLPTEEKAETMTLRSLLQQERRTHHRRERWSSQQMATHDRLDTKTLYLHRVTMFKRGYPANKRTNIEANDSDFAGRSH